MKLNFFKIFRLASLRGKRTGRKTGEGVKDTPGVVTMGNAFEDFAEVTGQRLRFHRWSRMRQQPLHFLCGQVFGLHIGFVEDVNFHERELRQSAGDLLAGILPSPVLV